MTFKSVGARRDSRVHRGLLAATPQPQRAERSPTKALVHSPRVHRRASFCPVQLRCMLLECSAQQGREITDVPHAHVRRLAPRPPVAAVMAQTAAPSHAPGKLSQTARPPTLHT